MDERARGRTEGKRTMMAVPACLLGAKSCTASAHTGPAGEKASEGREGGREKRGRGRDWLELRHSTARGPSTLPIGRVAMLAAHEPASQGSALDSLDAAAARRLRTGGQATAACSPFVSAASCLADSASLPTIPAFPRPASVSSRVDTKAQREQPHTGSLPRAEVCQVLRVHSERLERCLGRPVCAPHGSVTCMTKEEE